MKPSIVRGVLIFAAGAGCATVVAGGGWFPPEIKPEEFEPRLARAARELAEIGIYTVDVKEGMVSFTVSPAFCIPTPEPDIMEGRAVDPRWARKGLPGSAGMERRPHRRTEDQSRRLSPALHAGVSATIDHN